MMFKFPELSEALTSFFSNLKELRNTIVDPVELDQAIESLHSKYSKKMVSLILHFIV